MFMFLKNTMHDLQVCSITTNLRSICWDKFVSSSSLSSLCTNGECICLFLGKLVFATTISSFIIIPLISIISGKDESKMNVLYYGSAVFLTVIMPNHTIHHVTHIAIEIITLFALIFVIFGLLFELKKIMNLLGKAICSLFVAIEEDPQNSENNRNLVNPQDSESSINFINPEDSESSINFIKARNTRNNRNLIDPGAAGDYELRQRNSQSIRPPVQQSSSPLFIDFSKSVYMPRTLRSGKSYQYLPRVQGRAIVGDTRSASNVSVIPSTSQEALLQALLIPPKVIRSGSLHN